MRRLFLRNLLLCGLVIGFFSSCATANRNVSYARHPNLAEAQSFIEKAMTKISAAQEANDFDLQGHAAKAKELLDQAYTEIKLAALAANAHR